MDAASFAPARHIPAFLAVAKYGSFTKAARALYLSQPAVTVAIHQLEDMLGARLFDRSNHGAALTSKGRAFISKAEQLAADLESAVREISDADDVPRSLRVAAARSVSTQILPKALARYFASGAELDIVVHDSTSAEICRRVRGNEADLGFASMVGNDADLSFEPLFRDQIVVLARRGHAVFSKAGNIEWDHVARYDQIGLRSEVANDIISRMPGIPAKVREPRMWLQTTPYTVLWAMLHDSDNVSVLPALYAPDGATSGLTLRPLCEPGWRNVYAVTPKRRPPSPAIVELIRFVREVIAKISEDNPAIQPL